MKNVSIQVSIDGEKLDALTLSNKCDLHVDWDNGSTLALILGEDSLSVIGSDKQENAEAQTAKPLEDDLQMSGM